MGVVTNLGAHVDGGKQGPEGVDKDVVVDGGSEGSDVGCWIVSNIAMEWDELEEVLVYKFFLGVPKLLVVLVDDYVLVWVAVGGGGADGGGEKVGEKIGGSSGR